MKITNKHIYDSRTTRVMQTWTQLLRSYKMINAKESSFIAKNSLSMNQFEVLEALYHKGNLRIGELTRLIISTPGNMTVVIKNLKKNGYIDVIRCPDDRRSTILSITKLGEEKISLMFEDHSEKLKDCFGEFNDDEIEILFTLLRRLYKFNKKG